MTDKKTENKIKNIWDKEINKNLAKSFLLLENEKESQNFLRDLLTESEINEFSKRLETAFLLTKKISYKEIEKATSLSSTTIARISKWLSQDNDGYQNILEKLHHQKNHEHNHIVEFFDDKKEKEKNKIIK